MLWEQYYDFHLKIIVESGRMLGMFVQECDDVADGEDMLDYDPDTCWQVELN